MKKFFSTLFLVFGLGLIFSANAFADLYTFRAGNCPVVEITFYQYNKSDGTLGIGYGHPMEKNGRILKIPPHRTQMLAFNLSSNDYEYKLFYKYRGYYETVFGYERIGTFEKEILLNKNKKMYILDCGGGHRVIKSLRYRTFERLKKTWRKINSDDRVRDFKRRLNDWKRQVR